VLCEGNLNCVWLIPMHHLILLCMDPIALYLTSYCRIALPCIDLHTFLSCMCVSSYRVDTDTEQLEQEYKYHPQEDPACTSTDDLTGEPSPLHLFCSLYSCCSIAIQMLRFCSSHVSYSTCYPYELCFLTDTYHPLFVVWQAFRVIA
jgi:hypothetical protein